MTHPYQEHAEHKVSHKRVGKILKSEPAEMQRHASGGAFSRIMSKPAAVAHEDKAPGRKSMGRFARGGRAGSGKHIDGDSSATNLSQWAKRASANSYMRGGAITGVGRLEKAHKMKREGK